jgi:hypothetical protein
MLLYLNQRVINQKKISINGGSLSITSIYFLKFQGGGDLIYPNN